MMISVIPRRKKSYGEGSNYTKTHAALSATSPTAEPKEEDMKESTSSTFTFTAVLLLAVVDHRAAHFECDSHWREHVGGHFSGFGTTMRVNL